VLAGGAEAVRARPGDAALVLFPETIKTFSAIPETDPSCAIAYWGIAISQRPNPLVPPFSAEILKRGLDAVEKGEAIGAKTSASATGSPR